VYQTRQSTMSFVESVNRVSASRSLITPDQRRRAGLEPGDVVFITNLGIYQLDPTSEELVLTHLHPGVTLDAVRAATGFTLRISETLTQTPLPSSEMLRTLREEIDPLGIRQLEFVSAQDRTALLARCIAAEQDLIDRSRAEI
jgi:glutaconate CoA-transferase subunit A